MQKDLNRPTHALGTAQLNKAKFKLCGVNIGAFRIYYCLISRTLSYTFFQPSYRNSKSLPILFQPNHNFTKGDVVEDIAQCIRKLEALISIVGLKKSKTNSLHIVQLEKAGVFTVISSVDI